MSKKKRTAIHYIRAGEPLALVPNLAPRNILVGTTIYKSFLQVNSCVILSSTKCKYLTGSASTLRTPGKSANDTTKGLGGKRMLTAALLLLQ
jgi:hypothetical protein